MSALTLLLVAALCTTEGDKVCTYMDITQRMQVTTDQGCYELAESANLGNIESGQLTRYACVEPARYLALIGVEQVPVQAEAVKPRRAL